MGARTAAAVQPWAVSGGYANYMQADEPIERVRAAFGEESFDRLQALKRRYDPDNVLHRNQNIPPHQEGLSRVRGSPEEVFGPRGRSSSQSPSESSQTDWQGGSTDMTALVTHFGARSGRAAARSRGWPSSARFSWSGWAWPRIARRRPTRRR